MPGNPQTKDLTIPDRILDKWQDMVNIIAVTLQVPTVLITRLEAAHLRACRSSESQDNPVKEGYGFPLGGEDIYRGIYCEWVVTQKKKLNIPDASADHLWLKGLGSRFGLISYAGFPLLLPDGEVFGTICAMDYHANKFTTSFEMLLAQFKDLTRIAHLVPAQLTDMDQAIGPSQIDKGTKRLQIADDPFSRLPHGELVQELLSRFLVLSFQDGAATQY